MTVDFDASRIDLGRFLRPGVGVWWVQAGAEPTPLVHAVLDHADEYGPIRAFCGLSWDQRVTRSLPESVSLSSYGALGGLRTLSQAGRLTVVPCNYSAIPRLFAEGLVPTDVGLVQVSPPDADGMCTLGIGVDYTADAIAHTPVLIAEVNARMPATTGGPRIPMTRFDAVVETDRPLLTTPDRAPDDVERAIAAGVAALVEDGDTFQIGVGTLPAAVLDALSGHADLGVHSGMIADGVVDLVDKGVITGARKEIDAGVMVTGAALGRTPFYERMADLPLHFRAASYTHNPKITSQFASFVSINSAIDVDLSGQIGAEVRRGVYVGAYGGQNDYCHAAAASGKLSVIALRATSRGESTIKLTLDGPVTTSRSDVDAVVTEYGVAHLRGAGPEQRARRLIAIAAPEHRETLERATREQTR